MHVKIFYVHKVTRRSQKVIHHTFACMCHACETAIFIQPWPAIMTLYIYHFAHVQ